MFPTHFDLFFSLPGGELFQHVVENQRLSEDDTRFIFWQLFKGVEVSISFF
jgi:hypothetical protein